MSDLKIPDLEKLLPADARAILDRCEQNLAQLRAELSAATTAHAEALEQRRIAFATGRKRSHSRAIVTVDGEQPASDMPNTKELGERMRAARGEMEDLQAAVEDQEREVARARHSAAEALLRATGLRRFVDDVLDRALVGLEALEHARVDLERAEDRERERRAARNGPARFS